MTILHTVTASLKRIQAAKQGRTASVLGNWGGRSIALAACMVLTNFGADFSASAAGSLAEQSQNPISSLISMPFEFDSNQNVGIDNKTQNVMVFKPVVPVSINENWNLVMRGIIPFIDQPDSGPIDGNTGLGDIQFQTFFVPAKVKDLGNSNFLTWGVGPIAQFNSASDDNLGTGRNSLGINAVVFSKLNSWTVGALVSNIWSVDNSSTRDDVNLTTVQPIINYNLSNGWYLKSAPVWTYNHEADSGNEWTIPLGGGFGRVFNWGKQPVNLSLTAYGYAKKPDYASNAQIQAQIVFLFPK